MDDVFTLWSRLVASMLALSDKTSDRDMDVFNTHAKDINSTMMMFLHYHGKKEVE